MVGRLMGESSKQTRRLIGAKIKQLAVRKKMHQVNGYNDHYCTVGFPP